MARMGSVRSAAMQAPQINSNAIGAKARIAAFQREDSREG